MRPAGRCRLPSLRDRILEQARSERSNVVPLRRRRVLVPALSAAAAVAAVAAIGLGLWATSLSRDLDRADRERAVLSDPNARTFESEGGEANLVVAPGGNAALVVRKLAPAPEGKDYEIWVFEDGVPQRRGAVRAPGRGAADAPGRARADGRGHARAGRRARRSFGRAGLHRLVGLALRAHEADPLTGTPEAQVDGAELA